MVPRNSTLEVSTAVPFWGRITRNLTGLSAKRDCSLERVNSQGAKPRRLRL